MYILSFCMGIGKLYSQFWIFWQFILGGGYNQLWSYVVYDQGDMEDI